MKTVAEQPLDLASLIPSWRVSMKAEHKSASTLHSYTTGVTLYLRWCDDNGYHPLIDRNLVRAWTADLLDNGAQPSTVVGRQLAVRRFAVWLEEEGEIDVNPLLGLKAPRMPTKITPCLTDDEITRLVKVCEGKTFRDRRDEAIIRLLLETGMRRAELMALTVDDVDVARGLATIRKGKGSKGRIVPFEAKAGRALDRYLRMRARHPLADRPELWLGDRNRTFSYHGLRFALQRRAELAGIKGFHPHLTRHTFATRWKTRRGSDDGLMAMAGWSSRAMIDRYTASTVTERATAEARALNLGDF